jgi:heptosyltransferase-1
VERYGQVARALAGCGVQGIINYGPGEETLAREAEAASEGTAKAVACSVSELIALTRRARLFVGGDTGPMHLAAALQVPVVAIFGPTDPGRNGPYEFPTLRNSQRVGHPRSVVLRNPASATTHTRTARPDEAMLEISVDEVVKAACKVLGSGSEHSLENAHG